MLLTADEVVIADKHGTPGPEPVEGFQFGDDLLRGLVTGYASEEVYHIAKFTVKRASPGSLNRNGDVILQPQQIKPWGRRGGQIRLLCGIFDYPGLALFHGLKEQRNGILALAPHHKITTRLQDCLRE